MVKINFLNIVLLFTIIWGTSGCSKMTKIKNKKYEYDIELHNVSGYDLDWCSIYENPPKYNIFFESFGIMSNGVYKSKALNYGIIPNKVRLRYLFMDEVDIIANMRKAGKGKEEKKFIESKMKYIEFDIDTSKIKEILQKKKRPYLVISIIGLDKIETKIIPAD